MCRNIAKRLYVYMYVVCMYVCMYVDMDVGRHAGWEYQLSEDKPKLHGSETSGQDTGTAVDCISRQGSHGGNGRTIAMDVGH